MYVLHAVPDWSSLCVHILLEELGLPYRVQSADFDAGDLDRPAFRALNPFGLIPVLETPDGPIFETGAILLWLGDRHRVIPAPESPGRAAYLKWFVYVNASLHGLVMQVLHPYRAAGEAQARAVADTAHARLCDQLALAEAMLQAEDPPWARGEAPSPLAAYLAMLLRWVMVAPHFPDHAIRLDNQPALARMMAALERRPAVQRAAAAEGLPATLFTFA
jgi:glutathione S-transferase